MMATSIIIAMICVVIWAYLILARGAYWLASVRDATSIAGVPGPWPAVAAVIPARNESECIARSVQSLLRQDYRGPLTIVVVDDDSDDGTGAVATDAAAGDRAAERRQNDRTGRRLDRKTVGGQSGHCRGRSLRIPNTCCSPTPTLCTRPTRSPGWWRSR